MKYIWVKNHSKRTKEVYQRAIGKYTEYFSISMTELHEEAKAKEEQSIRWKKLLEYWELIEHETCLNR